jgi:hypothetical protein
MNPSYNDAKPETAANTRRAIDRTGGWQALGAAWKTEAG